MFFKLFIKNVIMIVLFLFSILFAIGLALFSFVVGAQTGHNVYAASGCFAVAVAMVAFYKTYTDGGYHTRLDRFVSKLLRIG